VLSSGLFAIAPPIFLIRKKGNQQQQEKSKKKRKKKASKPGAVQLPGASGYPMQETTRTQRRRARVFMLRVSAFSVFVVAFFGVSDEEVSTRSSLVVF
jgi:hypothetical protein